MFTIGAARLRHVRHRGADEVGHAGEVLADQRVLALVVDVDERRRRSRRRRCSRPRRPGRAAPPPRRPRCAPRRRPARRGARRSPPHRSPRSRRRTTRGSPRRGRRPRRRHRRTPAPLRSRGRCPTAAPVTIADACRRGGRRRAGASRPPTLRHRMLGPFDRPGRSHGVFRRRQARPGHRGVHGHRRGAGARLRRGRRGGRDLRAPGARAGRRARPVSASTRPSHACGPSTSPTSTRSRRSRPR